ncbi:MAG: hypothetical protein U0939_09500 [Pirellulales bacterium]
MAIAGQGSTVHVSAGRDGLAYGFEGYRGNIFAARDAVAISWGLTEGSVSAGRDAVNWSFAGPGGSVLAGQYAIAITWGIGFGPLTVTGDTGALAWSYQNCQCVVTSDSGWAGLASFDDAVGSVTAATDAFAWLVGGLDGSVEAGDSAAVIALGGLNGSVEAGSDAVVVAFAALSGSIAAGRDLALYAHGDVTGDLQAGRDAAVWTYGDMDADLHAQRDVLQLWARGDVTGAVIADRNIGWDDWSAGYSDAYADVFSHGSISATIQALNPNNLVDGGHIGRVVAAGGIGGGIYAASAIQQVRSGDAITAVLSAPLIGSVVEHDATIAVEFPYPDLPPTFIDQLLAEAADAYDQAAGWRSLLEDALNDAVAGLAAARAELAVELDEQRALVDAGRDEQLARRTALKAEGLSESNAERSALRSQLHLFLDRLRQDAEALVSDATAARDAASTQRNAGYAAAIQSTQSLREQLLDYDDELAQARDESLQESAERREAREASFTTAAKDVLPRPGAPRYSPSFLDEHPEIREAAFMSAAVFFPVPASLYWGTTLTSLRAIGNSVTNPLMEGVSIGAGTEPSSLFGGEDDPYYDYAYYPARITSEIILTLSPFALGNASRVGRVLQAIDFTSSAVGLVQQGHDIHQNGLNGWNGTLFVLNLLGTGLNGKRVGGDLSRVGKPLDGVADSAGALGNRADVVEDVAGAIAPKGGALGGLAHNTRRYRIPNRIVAEEVESQITRLEPLLDQHKIKIIRPLGPPPTKIVDGIEGPRFGTFDAENRIIYLYEGHGRLTYLEELHHLERAAKNNWLGIKPPDDEILDWERRFRNLLSNLGVELF